MDGANALASMAFTVWLVQAIGSTLTAAAYRRGLPQPEVPGRQPPVVVIVPVRGGGGLLEFLPLLRAQAYGRYHIVAAVESEQDPAFALLSAAAAGPGAPLAVVVAGRAVDAGQKVWNQLAALDQLTADDEIVAFIDADTRPSPLWLPRLVAVLVNSGRPVATGYRWMIPADGRFSSIALAAANNSIASLPRGALPLPLVWGGSVALRRETLDAIRIRDFWRGAISDDVQMAEALRAAGLLAHAPRQGLLMTPASASWREAFAFGKRQYRFILLHRPRTWAVALAALWTPPVCFLLAAPALVMGSAGAWAPLAAIVACGEIRTRLRRSLQLALWPEIDGPQENRRWIVERLLRPAWWMLHAASAAAAARSRTIDWAGVRYRVDAPQSVTIERWEAPN